MPDNQPYKVGILSPGDMGSATGRRLHDNGAEVYGVLTGRSVLTRLRASECGFIDAGIIGGPPADRAPTYFHCSGPDTAPFEKLADYGLIVNVVGPRIGQASGLKMMYAASTKGTTALWTEILVSARAMGLDEALYEQLGEGVVFKNQQRGIPMMPHRSRRWVGEMEEIALTFKTLGLTPKILEGAADMYRFVGGTKLGDQTPREPDPPLDVILSTLAEQLKD